MQNAPSISVFLPAFNEEGNIRASMERSLEVLRTITDTYEVIVVDDGSTDLTAAIVLEMAEMDPAIRLVQHEHNRGYGAALRTGIAAARFELIFFTDADMQFDIAELPPFVEAIAEADAVIGFRRVRKDPFVRLLNARLWNIANRLLFGLRVRDIDCGFKLFRRDVLKAVELHSEGAMVSAEMLLKLHDRGAILREIPVNHYPRTIGMPTGAKLPVILKALREMWHLYSTEMGGKIQIQFIKFATVGIVNAGVSILVYIVLTRTSGVLREHYLAAEVAAYLSGTVVSFLFNRQWTFRESWRTNLPEIVRFYATVLSALVLNVLVTYVLVGMVGVHDIFAVLIAGFCTVAWNFMLFKYWVFRTSGSVAQTASEGQGGDTIREFFKRWPRFYYAVMVICGPGFLSNLSAPGFLRKYPREGKTYNVGSGPREVAWDVINIDITPYESVSIVADASALPLPDGDAARLIYDTMLEHVERPEDVVAEASRVLERGGYLYATVPFLYPFHSSPFDYTRWTDGGVRSLFERYGFEVIEDGVRAGPFSIIVLWLSYFTASCLCFGNRRLYWLIVNLSFFVFFPIKILDAVAVRLPFAENLSSILYIVVRKK